MRCGLMRRYLPGGLMGRWHLPLALAVSAVARLASAGSDDRPAPPPRPPSTGKELERPKVVLPAEVQAEIARRAIKKGDCTGESAMLSTALGGAGARLSPDERISGYALLQQCAK